MASNTRIDGSVPNIAAGANIGTIFSRGWAVDYDWGSDKALASGQPRRLATLGFPGPFDQDLDGVLRGREAFSDFIYLFKAGQYIRLRAATMTPDGLLAPIASAWSLPALWTGVDAVLPGSGKKINFAYFFRGTEYGRYDWTTDKLSPPFPKTITTEWHTTAPFLRDFDGVIIGQGGFSTKAYLFRTNTAQVDDEGKTVSAGTLGSHAVNAPSYIRYDFDAEATQGAETDPAHVVASWNGLLPLLDAGPAIDLAITWCNAGIAGLMTPLVPIVANALAHHFRTATPTPAQLAAITTRLTAVRDRLISIPDRFRWTAGLAFAAQTTPGLLTEIGDGFSTVHGPNGRAAVMIHEAVHFTALGGPAIDVPEWSGEIINGTPFGIDSLSGRPYQGITTDEALTNPGSYASFAQEIALLGTDARFGAAHPQE